MIRYKETEPLYGFVSFSLTLQLNKEKITNEPIKSHKTILSCSRGGRDDRCQVIDGGISTNESDFWQGTIVYMQLQTDKEIDPQEVVAYRTDVTDEFDTLFLNDNELEQLW